MKNINQNDWNDLTPAQKMLQELEIKRNKEKVRNSYIWLIILIISNILAIIGIYSTSGFYYLFNEKPKYEELKIIKGIARLVTISGGTKTHISYTLSINGTQTRCNPFDIRTHDKFKLDAYINKPLEAKVDKFNIPYECIFDNKVIKKYYHNNKTIFVFLILYLLFLLIPLILLTIFIYKRNIVNINKNYNV